MAGPSKDQLASIIRAVFFFFRVGGRGYAATGKSTYLSVLHLCVSTRPLLFLHNRSHLALTRQPGTSVVVAPNQTPRQLGTSAVTAPN